MAHQGSRAAFDSLLAKAHVQHALLQPDGSHNDIPGVGLEEADMFQRAFMTYFSMENGRFAGNSKALAISHLFTQDPPLIYGLFSGIGRPLTLLSDGIELRAAILVMQSLTLSAVDWMEPMCELLTRPVLAAAPPQHLAPEDILNRVAYDGRLSGVMKAGPGFHGVSHVFASATAKAAVVEYVRCLDTRDLPLVLQQLAALSVLLLCATHKPGRPAFDLYLGRLPTCVNSTRVVLESWVEDHSHGVLLVRGLWLLVLLVYVTQLRPAVDGKLLVSPELAQESRGWEAIFDEFRGQAVPEGKYADVDFLRALRSLRELSAVYGAVHGRLYLHAAWKLVSQWRSWTGLGINREVMLNIRL
ncbi:uncharacterized protein THITE_2145306 [Thermothielavioides terrestris NRRL 8126]|uniref:Uncharacterized protein n=1 Tax=Thermothielavioides terrestris (strain ATCC 38088 / NRRL 8126) TaxID=578455 RepID=G2R809_THETT|nr:uncharacterized protein THITE_2145306 [Thermothielavioides terrestris NRRL 8126]AEO68068.1 hypothetical protein THITE_2145306 [Thermothielavioides terrestris NRRL 8126]